jgi:hypothetical protein
MSRLDDARRFDRIERLIRKNAALLNEPHIALRVTKKSDGRVSIGLLPDFYDDGALARIYTYADVDEAYRATLRAHLRGHAVRRERAAA